MLDLDPLIKVSRTLGSNPGYIQGGGGNTSLKDGSGIMHIKSSGVSLAHVTADHGFVPVDWGRIKSEIGFCRTEADYSQLLAESMIGEADGRRPSIETGFHALLGPCVLHSHSVWVNQLTCAEEGCVILPDLFPEALWVPYLTPGLHLTLEIQRRMEGAERSVIFLQNHGLVVSGAEPSTTHALHEDVNTRIRQRLGETTPFPCSKKPLPGANGVLFPDQAVYLHDPTLAHTQAGQQTLDAYAYLLDAIPRLGLTPRFLEESDVGILLGLDSEKYRQRIAQT